MVDEEKSSNLKSVVIIDDDELMAQLIEKYCQDLGFEEIATFNNAAEAWDEMNQREVAYQFVISDWQIPGLSGIAFFNRLKTSIKYANVPVLVISGFLNRNDFALLEDYPMTSLMEKPFTKAAMLENIENLDQDKTWYDKNESEIITIIEELSNSPEQFGEKILNAMKNSPNPTSFGIHLGKKLREFGQFQSAQLILSWVIKQSPKSIMAMMECARVFKDNGNLKEALNIIDLANFVSPENVERLCMGGEINLQLNDVEKAKVLFDKALSIDSESEMALAGTTLSDNLSDHFKSHDQFNLPNTFAGILNLLGIEKVRNGDFSDGMKQYDAALVFIKEATSIAKLRFNKGLGFMRWGKPDDALGEFRQAKEVDAGYSRSNQYIAKLEAMFGSNLKNFVNDHTSDANNKDFDEDKGLEMGLFASSAAPDTLDQSGELSGVIPEEEADNMMNDDFAL